jgi:hypothetical protein
MPSTESNSTLCVLGRIEEIAKGSLTGVDLLERGEDKVAPIIRVIENNQMHLIPKESFTNEFLKQRVNHSHENCFHLEAPTIVDTYRDRKHTIQTGNVKSKNLTREAGLATIQ